MLQELYINLCINQVHRGSVSHVTYSLVDPHGIWVTLISHALVAVVDAVLNENAKVAVSEDEVPKSTYTTMKHIVIKMMNLSMWIKQRLLVFVLMLYILTMLSTILTTNCGRSWCNATLKQNKLWTVIKPTCMTYFI